jgi:NAD(P)-dependent dehydrogenase (short-subunit alcohol dehydrogenase family)
VNDLGTSPDGSSTAAGQAGEARAQQVVDEITAAGGQAVADLHSVADPDGARALVETALESFGRLDAVVNNAGIVRRGFVHQVSVPDYDFVVGVHLLGSIRVTEAAWGHLQESGRGRVIFTSSSIGLLGSVSTAPYATSKLALVGLTRLLATAGAPSGIRVNAIAPMAVTRLNQPVMEQIFGEHTAKISAERVAPVVAYLAHRDCQLNGEVLSVAGGRVARFAAGVGPAVPGLDSPDAVAGALDRLTATEPATWWPTLA